MSVPSHQQEPTYSDILSASTGNVCTVRCRNNALAGPFGGCFAVQQTDTTTKTNVASEIDTIQNMDAVLAQVQQNQADFANAVQANQDAGTEGAAQNLAAVDALLSNSVVSAQFTQETPSVVLGGVPAPATTTVAAAATNDASAGNGNNDNNGNNNVNNNRGGNNRNGNQFGGNNKKRMDPNAMRWAKRGVSRAQRRMLE